MSEVKKISPVGNIYGWEESQFGEFVLSQDYDDLAEEAQALRDERDSQQPCAQGWWFYLMRARCTRRSMLGSGYSQVLRTFR
ncbi:hypothetical protein ABZQ24_05455 [Pseudomonas aeruginosa]|uniref:hypothetical protein n=1 Tax=Pseudomonas aeruginosa TaxID=287 RepID=UPI000FFF328C|nr:hypothetical protein [Pseudomonas aeruginosa]HBO3382709.1 hypothetical protein [Pseudomonas aeruginosa]HBO3669309.1 hypothetical protein [Pseudomonas aeruginosa]HCF7758372.1 hypothetical protein [Pseudomonas aeruginosa]